MKNSLFIILSIMILFVSCNSKNNNTINTSLASPNGKYVAYIFTRDLGATTRVSYHLSILKKDEQLGDISGNIYTSYENFEVEWISNEELYVYNTESKIFKQETSKHGISIDYTYIK